MPWPHNRQRPERPSRQCITYTPPPNIGPYRPWLDHPHEWVAVGLDRATGEAMLMRKADIVGYREQDVPTLRIWDDPGQRAWTGDTPVPTSSPTHQQDGERVVRQFNVHQPVEQSIESILDNVASARGLTRDKLVAILHDLERVGLIEPAPR